MNQVSNQAALVDDLNLFLQKLNPIWYYNLGETEKYKSQYKWSNRKHATYICENLSGIFRTGPLSTNIKIYCSQRSTTNSIKLYKHLIKIVTRAKLFKFP